MLHDGLVRVEDVFGDWLACAVGGRDERAVRAARKVGGVEALATAGHVLDFDDTYLPGLAHLSAAVAPAALAVAAESSATTQAMLDAYEAGVHAMAALAKAGHPALYDGGWHPTAVTGVVGAATAAAHLLHTDERAAAALSLTRAGGNRGAFGSDAKALQVGLAAAAGVQAARLVAAGAHVDAPRLEAAYETTFHARHDTTPATDVFAEIWIKTWPCCLQTHGAIEAALRSREKPGQELTVVVHPVSTKAANVDDPATGLEAKFSIAYLTAFTLRHGEPRGTTFAIEPDEQTRADARRITIKTDPTLLESEARLERNGTPVGHTTAALGSPRQPLSTDQLEAKRTALVGTTLNLGLPPRDLLALV